MSPKRRFLPRSYGECQQALGEVEDPVLRAALDGMPNVGGESLDESAAEKGAQLFRLLSKPKPGDWLDSHEELGQTFPQYAKRMDPKSGGSLPRPACNGLLVCPIGKSFSSELGALFMPFLMRYYEAFFPGMTVDVLEKPLSLKDVQSRENEFGHKQYLIGDIFTMLNTDRKVISLHRSYSRLGVTLEDIYPGDEWNYVFGQARPLERVGVFSFARHSPVFYNGVHASDALAMLSVPQLLGWLKTNRQTMCHETCHIFGILHCVHWHCMMNGNNGPGDSAGATFLCPVCLRKLLHALGGLCGRPSIDVMDDRYAGLEAQLLSLQQEMDVEKSSICLRRDLEWLRARRAQLAELRTCAPPPDPHPVARPPPRNGTVASQAKAAGRRPSPRRPGAVPKRTPSPPAQPRASSRNASKNATPKAIAPAAKGECESTR
eukprot:TRINITY_DN32679_c0_g1_i1.p1 TRINITY_DN32679_c0_g1~~TRINITY_DN32679_c0_g1_i1.p1  ORF type:complete len:433 (-),score=36.96 TRINITY_DN32679_c0_g1_i1:211-1509(-)